MMRTIVFSGQCGWHIMSRSGGSAELSNVGLQQVAEAIGGERCRAESKLANLAAQLEQHRLNGSTGIDHTRWTTQGRPNEVNAHRHANERVAVIDLVTDYLDRQMPPRDAVASSLKRSWARSQWPSSFPAGTT